MKEENNDFKACMETSTLKTEVERLVQENNLHFCLECGKCSAICPMLNVYGGYLYDRSPRGVVERLSIDPENLGDEVLWYCLPCQACTFLCPSGVNFQSFMTELRELLLRHGYRKYALFCPQCGRYFLPKAEFEYIQKMVDGRKMGEYLSICPECKTFKYMETLKAAIHGERFRKVNR